jgi:hypothetical protein
MMTLAVSIVSTLDVIYSTEEYKEIREKDVFIKNFIRCKKSWLQNFYVYLDLIELKNETDLATLELYSKNNNQK